MEKKVFFAATYLTILPATLICLTVYLIYSLHLDTSHPTTLSESSTKHAQFRALPEERYSSEHLLSPQDRRVVVIKDFLSRYKSPLATHAEKIVKASDKYNLDYRLLPAIAMKESTLCKKTPKNSYNCFGFGIYGGKVKKFKGYDEAIEAVSKTLSQKYIEKGFESPEQIMTKYTPASSGTWANTVNFIMDKLESSL